MSCTEENVKEQRIRFFSKDSQLCVVIATVAFGMGAAMLLHKLLALAINNCSAFLHLGILPCHKKFL